MAVKQKFDFKLGDDVKLSMSGEDGKIVSRSHSLESTPQYFVRYVAADGRQVEAWVAEQALVKA